jgi:molybdenum cofactor biosynthesis enzyme MoaA
MNKKFLYLVLIVSNCTYAQQESKIKVDSGNKNEVTVIQQGKDSIQKSGIDIYHADSNKVKVNQTILDSTKNKEEAKGLMHYANNTNIILGIIASLIAIISLFAFRKKSARQK